MEIVRLLLAFAALIFGIDAAVTTLHRAIPDHYELSHQYSCEQSLDIYMDRGALLAYSNQFLKNKIREGDFDCTTTMLQRTSGDGVIAVIQKLRFRKTPTACIDHVIFHDSSPILCGDMVFGLRKGLSGRLPPTPPFISAFSGLFDRRLVHPEEDDALGNDLRLITLSRGSWLEIIYRRMLTTVHVSNLPPLEFDEDLDLVIAYTMYKSCESENTADGFFNCGYGLCILNMYVNDGVVNCPFGDCRDEGGCENALLISPFTADEQNVTETAEAREDHLQRIPKHLDMAAHRPVVNMFTFPKESSQTVEVVNNIAKVLRDHNKILGHMAELMERGVMAMEGKSYGTAQEVEFIKGEKQPSYSPPLIDIILNSDENVNTNSSSIED